MVNTIMPVLTTMGMALAYVCFFGLFGHFTNRSVENTILRRSSIHGHHSFFRKFFNGISRALGKEEHIPRQGHKLLFILTPPIAFSIALGMWTNAIFIPGAMFFSGSILTVYVLYLLLTLTLISVAWASNSKYPIIASFRILKLLIPIELAFLFLFFSIGLHFNTFEINIIAEAQAASISSWGIIRQPLIGLVFLFLILIKCVQTPFDYIITSSELAGGVLAEYSVFGKSLVKNALKLSYLFSHLFFVVVFLGAAHLPIVVLPFNSDAPSMYAIQSLGIILVKYIVLLGLTRIVRLGFPTVKYIKVMCIIKYWVIPVMLLNMLVTIVVSRVL
ncbi:MAG: NADH-quinone oxidoreductase subunit H [Bacteriovoracaceae bacterium]|nr:NADH-quinone oxidoreductase subunit H [Bacteriovoracaceae bacterium]